MAHPKSKLMDGVFSNFKTPIFNLHTCIYVNCIFMCRHTQALYVCVLYGPSKSCLGFLRHVFCLGDCLPCPFCVGYDVHTMRIPVHHKHDI